MAVKAATATIRSDPNAKAQQLWQVEKYHPLLVLEIKNNWCRVKDFEGDQGWVQISSLDKTPTVIVKVNRCNVRSGPGPDKEIAFTVDKGIPFKVLQKKGDWLEVQHADGDRGWVLKSLVW
ncbi:MAG: SH3 domain-containing protein [Desulfobacteraceae bacterium]|nr:SH3 domain-containing protein [Desulfobacteraceae bacterium]